MKLKNLLIALFAASLSLGFVSCKDDDETEAVIDHIVNYALACGDYDCTIEYYVTDNVANLSADDKVSSDKAKATIKEGKDLRTLTFDDDIELLDFTNAENGFVFNLKAVSTEGIRLTPIKAAELGGVKYNGIFTDSDRTITMYYQVPLEDCFSEEDSEEIFESLLTAYIAAGLVGADEAIESMDQLLELLDDAKIIVKITGKQISIK